ncbi:MAG TPA: aminotransferase class V-fold PLP-dependent enzyme [Elusimicrobiota bacterium]|nr:aminotransferase class V-fold PLP-dependent enzyme [Elusimicrobiota bacterium]
MSCKSHYSRFLKGLGERLHFCAHSHHPWPDCTREAQIKAWDDAAERADEKWEIVIGEQVPHAQKAIAAVLRLPDEKNIAFAPNTHEFACRILSCLPEKPKVLTTDSEFHSFSRQMARLQEEGAEIERIAVEPFETFPRRFAERAEKNGWDLVFLSHTFFNSGFRLSEGELMRVAAGLSDRTLFVIDGYHTFMAAPIDLSQLGKRAFYLAGGYKYAQAGEGVCFMAVPPGCALRPKNTGWFADFAGLERAIEPPVNYGDGGWRFWGSTFDPAGLYRWNAVSAWRKSLNLTVEVSDAHVRALQRKFLERLVEKPRGPFAIPALVSEDLTRLGHFLTFRLPHAPAVSKRLAAELGVLTDARQDRLRFGFGLYHDEADIDELFRRLDRFA